MTAEYLSLEGGEGLRFGEIITAVAMSVVIFIVLDFVFLTVLFPTMGPSWGFSVASLAAVFVSALIVGLVFAEQIRESRMGSIARIAVLGTVLLMFGTMIAFATDAYWGTMVQETLQGAYSTSGWATADWYAYSWKTMISTVAVNVVEGFVLGFVGLYLGSLRKRSK